VPDLFLIKAYGDLYPSIGQCDIISDYEQFSPNNCGIDFRCGVYFSDQTPDGITVESAGVSIIKINDMKMFNILLIKKFKTKKNKINILKMANAEIIHEENPAHVSYIWISNDSMITVGSHNMPVPEQMLEDYLDRYPPSYKFIEEDFDESRLPVLERDMHIKMIKEAKKLRGFFKRLFKKTDEYIGIIAQCDAEHDLRLTTGSCIDGKANCPIAFTINDLDRKYKWKKFLEQARNAQLIETFALENKCDFWGKQYETDVPPHI
jgi:hypothetical protein